ncbi:MAG: adenylosuccinate synthetase [Bryobacteraceae bacterium]|jgi:adenylosuccinate synthase
MSVWVVVGGQFGSEGKGKISAIITLQEQIDVCIRCGGPNSGHSFQGQNGEMVLLRQLPTGFVRPQTRLLIPAGGLVDLEVLRSEIAALGLDARRVGVDRNAMVITPDDRDQERRLGLGERLSSTLCGVGSAVARRVLRSGNVDLAANAAMSNEWLRPFLTDVSAESNLAVDRGKKVLIEGTQGSGLSLYHTSHYPKATSRDTNAAGFLSEVGLSPRLVSEIVVVFRTFPIRVAGAQAGPLHEELTWEQLQAESRSPVPLHEYTSVTHKLRRLGRFDWDAASRALMLNRPTRLALNFVDYLGFENRGTSRLAELTNCAQRFIDRLGQLGVPICYVGTGPRLSDNIRPGFGSDLFGEQPGYSRPHLQALL